MANIKSISVFMVLALGLSSAKADLLGIEGFGDSMLGGIDSLLGISSGGGPKGGLIKNADCFFKKNLPTILNKLNLVVYMLTNPLHSPFILGPMGLLMPGFYTDSLELLNVINSDQNFAMRGDYLSASNIADILDPEAQALNLAAVAINIGFNASNYKDHQYNYWDDPYGSLIGIAMGGAEKSPSTNPLMLLYKEALSKNLVKPIGPNNENKFNSLYLKKINNCSTGGACSNIDLCDDSTTIDVYQRLCAEWSNKCILTFAYQLHILYAIERMIQREKDSDSEIFTTLNHRLFYSEQCAEKCNAADESCLACALRLAHTDLNALRDTKNNLMFPTVDAPQILTDIWWREASAIDSKKDIEPFMSELLQIIAQLFHKTLLQENKTVNQSALESRIKEKISACLSKENKCCSYVTSGRPMGIEDSLPCFMNWMQLSYDLVSYNKALKHINEELTPKLGIPSIRNSIPLIKIPDDITDPYSKINYLISAINNYQKNLVMACVLNQKDFTSLVTAVAQKFKPATWPLVNGLIFNSGIQTLYETSCSSIAINDLGNGVVCAKNQFENNIKSLQEIQKALPLLPPISFAADEKTKNLSLIGVSGYNMLKERSIATTYRLAPGTTTRVIKNIYEILESKKGKSYADKNIWNVVYSMIEKEVRKFKDGIMSSLIASEIEYIIKYYLDAANFTKEIQSKILCPVEPYEDYRMYPELQALLTLDPSPQKPPIRDMIEEYRKSPSRFLKAAQKGCSNLSDGKLSWVSVSKNIDDAIHCSNPLNATTSQCLEDPSSPLVKINELTKQISNKLVLFGDFSPLPGTEKDKGKILAAIEDFQKKFISLYSENEKLFTELILNIFKKQGGEYSNKTFINPWRDALNYVTTCEKTSSDASSILLCAVSLGGDYKTEIDKLSRETSNALPDIEPSPKAVIPQFASSSEEIVKAIIAAYATDKHNVASLIQIIAQLLTINGKGLDNFWSKIHEYIYLADTCKAKSSLAQKITCAINTAISDYGSMVAAFNNIATPTGVPPFDTSITTLGQDPIKNLVIMALNSSDQAITKDKNEENFKILTKTVAQLNARDGQDPWFTVFRYIYLVDICKAQPSLAQKVACAARVIILDQFAQSAKWPFISTYSDQSVRNNILSAYTKDAANFKDLVATISATPNNHNWLRVNWHIYQDTERNKEASIATALANAKLDKDTYSALDQIAQGVQWPLLSTYGAKNADGAYPAYVPKDVANVSTWIQDIISRMRAAYNKDTASFKDLAITVAAIPNNDNWLSINYLIYYDKRNQNMSVTQAKSNAQSDLLDALATQIDTKIPKTSMLAPGMQSQLLAAYRANQKDFGLLLTTMHKKLATINASTAASLFWQSVSDALTFCNTKTSIAAQKVTCARSKTGYQDAAGKVYAALPQDTSPSSTGSYNVCPQYFAPAATATAINNQQWYLCSPPAEMEGYTATKPTCSTGMEVQSAKFASNPTTYYRCAPIKPVDTLAQNAIWQNIDAEGKKLQWPALSTYGAKNADGSYPAYVPKEVYNNVTAWAEPIQKRLLSAYGSSYIKNFLDLIGIVATMPNNDNWLTVDWYLYGDIRRYTGTEFGFIIAEAITNAKNDAELNQLAQNAQWPAFTSYGKKNPDGSYPSYVPKDAYANVIAWTQGLQNRISNSYSNKNNKDTYKAFSNERTQSFQTLVNTIATIPNNENWKSVDWYLYTDTKRNPNNSVKQAILNAKQDAANAQKATATAGMVDKTIAQIQQLINEVNTARNNFSVVNPNVVRQDNIGASFWDPAKLPAFFTYDQALDSLNKVNDEIKNDTSGIPQKLEQITKLKASLPTDATTKEKLAKIEATFRGGSQIAFTNDYNGNMGSITTGATTNWIQGWLAKLVDWLNPSGEYYGINKDTRGFTWMHSKMTSCPASTPIKGPRIAPFWPANWVTDKTSPQVRSGFICCPTGTTPTEITSGAHSGSFTCSAAAYFVDPTTKTILAQDQKCPAGTVQQATKQTIGSYTGFVCAQADQYAANNTTYYKDWAKVSCPAGQVKAQGFPADRPEFVWFMCTKTFTGKDATNGTLSTDQQTYTLRGASYKEGVVGPNGFVYYPTNFNYARNVSGFGSWKVKGPYKSTNNKEYRSLYSPGAVFDWVNNEPTNIVDIAPAGEQFVEAYCGNGRWLDNQVVAIENSIPAQILAGSKTSCVAKFKVASAKG